MKTETLEKMQELLRVGGLDLSGNYFEAWSSYPGKSLLGQSRKFCKVIKWREASELKKYKRLFSGGGKFANVHKNKSFIIISDLVKFKKMLKEYC